MTVHAFLLDGSDHVIKYWRGKGPEIPAGHIAASETDYSTVQTRLHIEGTEPAVLRWKYIAGALEEQPDTRPTGTWSQTAVDLDVGDPSGTVSLTLSVPINGPRVMTFTSGHRLRLNFVDGVTSLDIPTSVPFQSELSSSPNVRLLNRLRVRVLGNDIYPVRN